MFRRSWGCCGETSGYTAYNGYAVSQNDAFKAHLNRQGVLKFLVLLEKEEREKYRKNPNAYQDEADHFVDNVLMVSGHSTYKETFLNRFSTEIDPMVVVNLSIARAIKRIACCNKVDTKTKFPIYNTNIPVYEWTALVLMGSVLLDKKFGPINVQLWNYINIGSQLGYVTLFSYYSLYHTAFKQFIDEDRIRSYLHQSQLVEVKKAKVEIAEREKYERRYQQEQATRPTRSSEPTSHELMEALVRALEEEESSQRARFS